MIREFKSYLLSVMVWMVPRARLVIEGRQLKYTLRIKTKTKGRMRANTFVESQ
jgi:hypothetical protein